MNWWFAHTSNNNGKAEPKVHCAVQITQGKS